MRLGAWDCKLEDKTIAAKVYKDELIKERHRRRYELNSGFMEQIQSAGMKATGLNPDTGLVEIIEIPKHPWFVGVQYHPEYKSTVANPLPLFVAFVKSALKYSINQKSVSMA